MHRDQASAKAALQTQINSLSTSQSSSSTELDTLRHRVEDTEREKRDLVGVVSRLKEDSSQREGQNSKLAHKMSLLILYNRGGAYIAC